MPHSTPKDLNLKSLELFQICAEHGSLSKAAQETGLTISTVSHHLRNLENHLGVALFNHSTRPMALTPKGHAFLRNIRDALYTIRKAKAEASSGTIADASHMRIGTIEDFDSDITPELAVFLSKNMPNCSFAYYTDASKTIVEMLRNRHLDLGITATPPERIGDLQETPLLRDPFVIVLPRNVETPSLDLLEGRAKLPYLRFSNHLIIARQIETQLRRFGYSFASQFECSNNQTLMAMVANGAGWTITTPLLFARAKRFHPKLAMHAFPGKRFSRSLALLSTPDCSRAVIDLVDENLRRLIKNHIIQPQVQRAPWLENSFILLDG